MHGPSFQKELYSKEGSAIKNRELVRKRPPRKAQSAMEYLMTYGWAILIIAVVLGALFSLGVFNPNSFAPKAQPGSCQVLRPYGAGTSIDLNLGGTCLNELPKFVAQLNGQNSYVTLPTSGLAYGNNPDTMCGWTNLAALPGTYGSNDGWSWIAAYGTGSGGASRFIGFGLGFVDVGGYGPSYDLYYYTDMAKFVGRWNFICGTYDGTYVRIYVNGTLVAGPAARSWDTIQSEAYIGKQVNPFSEYLDGLISNVQIYNSSLGANAISALYGEGVGGAPIDLQHLVAWYPLNGDTMDYSGNNNDGTPINTIFTGSWTSGYSSP